MPGGKVDGDESFYDAVKREVFEETGLQITSADQLFQAMCEGKVSYWTVCYLVTAYEGTPASREEGIIVKWASWDELLSARSPFCVYNRRVFKAARAAALIC